LKLGEVQRTVPTIGFNVELVDYQNISFLVWDVGGQEKLRMLCRHYQNTDALIFVVDSVDTHRNDLARRQLEQLVHVDELKDAIVLVFANKQDFNGAIDTRTLERQLRLSNLENPWYIQPCTATEGSGLYEGLDWLSTTLSKRS
jgi:small GTP-binding protein